MLTFSCLCSTTVTEASEVQARLQELSTEILQSSHTHSALLRDLISRQDSQARVLEEIRSYTSTLTLASTSSSTNILISAHPSESRHNSDNVSTMSKRSTFSIRSGRPDYMEDLKASRAYKRLRHLYQGVNSSSESARSFESGGSAGNWSMLSDMSLGDLSVSQIAVLNLPIDLSDVSNPEPFQEPSSTEIHRSRPKTRRRWSSRGRLHNAIENGNSFAVRTVLAMGMDIEELDLNGRTPLLHATMKRQEAICKMLIEKGASIEALRLFTSGMNLKERSELFDPLIQETLGNGSSSAVLKTVLRLLVVMALGTNNGGGDTRSSSQVNVAVDLNYELAVRAIIQLNPQVLTEVDTRGRTPFTHAYELRRNEICELILKNLIPEEEPKSEDVVANVLGLRLVDDAFAAIMGDCACLSALELQLAKSDGSIVHAANGHLPAETNDRIRLAVSSYHTKIRELIQLATTFPTINRAAQLELTLGTKLNGYIHTAIRQECPQVLEFLLLVDADIGLGGEDDQGRTPLAHAAYKCHDSMCHILLKAGAKREGLQKIGQRVSLKGSIHTAIDRRCKISLDLLLEMGAHVEEVDIEGRTPLIHAAQLALTSKIDTNNYESLDYICRALLEATNTETVKHMVVARTAVSMHDLVEKDYKSILQLLSLIESRDAEGWTPLASAAFNNNEALCEFLVDKGCTLSLDTEQKKQLKPKLLRRIHVAARGGHETSLELLLDMGADTNERDSAGGTALQEAVYNNHLSCVKMLIASGADATILTNSRRTVLHRAAWAGNEQIMKFLLDDVVETRKLVNAKDSFGDTALHDCRIRNQSHESNQSAVVSLEMAKMLLQAGATPTIKNSNRQTPYEVAREMERKELAKYLWSQLSPEQQAREKPPHPDW